MGLEDRACGKRWPCFVHSNHVRGCETNSDKILYIYKKNTPETFLFIAPLLRPKIYFWSLFTLNLLKRETWNILGAAMWKKMGFHKGRRCRSWPSAQAWGSELGAPASRWKAGVWLVAVFPVWPEETGGSLELQARYARWISKPQAHWGDPVSKNQVVKIEGDTCYHPIVSTHMCVQHNKHVCGQVHTCTNTFMHIDPWLLEPFLQP